MLLDILKFLFIYCLVLLAFANGLNQLYFYYETDEGLKGCKGIRCATQNNAFSTLVKTMHYNVFVCNILKFWLGYNILVTFPIFPESGGNYHFCNLDRYVCFDNYLD